MNLEIQKNSKYSVAVLKESGLVSMRSWLPLISAWIVSLFLPVLLMGLGFVIGLLIDKAILHCPKEGPASALGVLIPGLFIAGFYAGWINVTLYIAKKEPMLISDFFRPIPQMFSAATVLILTTILIACAAGALFLLPFLAPFAGGFLFLKFQLAPYFVVDQEYGPIGAMKQSWAATNKIFVPLAIMDLIFAGISAAFSFTIVAPFAVFLVQSVATGMVYARWVVDDELEQIEMDDED